MENKTENKFGNFLNFMKKFLAMSFFCAIAAFGFGASNTWADASTTPESSFVDKASVTDIEADETDTINKLDDVYYKIGSNNEAEAVKMANEDKTSATIYGNFNGKADSMTGTQANLKKIDAGLLNGKLKDLTIENYQGGITVNGTVTRGNELDTLTAVGSNGDKVAAAKNDSELLKLVGGDSNKINPGDGGTNTSGTDNGGGTGNGGAATGDGGTNTSGTDNGGGTGNGGAATGDGGTNTSGTDNGGGTGNGDTATGDGGTNTSGTDNGGAGNGGTATGDGGNNGSNSGSGNGNGSGSSESGSGNESNGNNPGTETGDNLTPANVTSTSELEYESGKTTWGELLVKAGVNTSKNDGATGVWKVKAGSLSRDLINYGKDKEEYLSSIPIEPGLESATLTYEHGENDKFSDSGNIVISLKDISEDVDKEKFGDKKTFGSHAFYVNDETGETSAIISSEKDKITWLRESSDGTEAWYGFNNNSSENSKAALKDGSIVSVKWTRRTKENSKEFDKKVLEATKGEGLQSLNLSVEDDNIWLFELNGYKKSTDDNGNVTWEKVDKSDFKDKMEVYIELGDDWDINDINAIWLDNQEQLSTPEIVNEEINGVNKRFAVLKLDHFSNYLVYDKKTAEDIIKKLKEIGEEKKAEYLKTNPNATQEELDEIAEQAVVDAYNNLSEKDKEQLDNFLAAMSQNQSQSTVSDADKDNSASNSSSYSSSGSSKTSSSSDSSWSSSLDSPSGSSYSTSSSSSKVKTGKRDNLSILLFLLSSCGILSLNLAMRKRHLGL